MTPASISFWMQRGRTRADESTIDQPGRYAKVFLQWPDSHEEWLRQELADVLACARRFAGPEHEAAALAAAVKGYRARLDEIAAACGADWQGALYVGPRSTAPLRAAQAGGAHG